MDWNDIVCQIDVGQDLTKLCGQQVIEMVGDTQAGFSTVVSYFTVVFTAKEMNSASYVAVEIISVDFSNLKIISQFMT